MKKILLLILFVNVFQLYAEGTKITDLDAKQAYLVIQEQAKNPAFVIIDIRTPDEYNRGHIEGAVNIDFYGGAFDEEVSRLDKTKNYFIYCRSGNRSSQALSIFKKYPFKEIYHLKNGIIDWQKENLPLVK